MTNPIFISIIIPAYNAEKYIQQCIMSLIRQDLPLSNYEILVINDGSTDNTYSILERLSEEYSNIHVFTTANKGVSNARNLGIETAQGEILLFVDADDYMVENTLSTIYHTMKTDNLDILLFDYYYWDVQGKLLKEFDRQERNNFPENITSGQTYIQVDALPSTVWTLAYRTTHIKEKELRFINIRHEDEEFIPRSFYFANRVKYIKLTAYNYVQSETSFMQNYKETGFFDYIIAMDSLKQFAERHIKETTTRQALEKRISSRLLMNLRNSFLLGSKVQSKMIKQMKQKHLNATLHKKKKIYWILYTYFPSLFIAYFKHRYIRHRSKYQQHLL